MQFKSFAFVAALAVGAIANPIANPIADPVADPVAEPVAAPSSTGAPPPPPIDTAGFTAVMKANEGAGTCFAILDFPSIGCNNGKTGTLMKYNGENNRCWEIAESNRLSDDVCGPGTSVELKLQGDQGLLEFTNGAGQKVQAKWDLTKNNNHAIIDGGAHGKVAAST